MAVVADVHAHLADGGVEHRVATVAGREVELLPEALGVRDVLFAVLAQVLPIGIDDSRRVVVQAGAHNLVHRQHQHNARFASDALEALGGGAVGDLLGVVVVLGLLHLTEVGTVEELLEAHHLGPRGLGLVYCLLVFVEHGLLGAGPVGLQ